MAGVVPAAAADAVAEEVDAVGAEEVDVVGAEAVGVVAAVAAEDMAQKLILSV